MIRNVDECLIGIRMSVNYKVLVLSVQSGIPVEKCISIYQVP